MAKWAGKIGFTHQHEQLTPDGKHTGVWIDELIEKNYYGDIYKNSRALDNGTQINDGIDINMQVSFIADPYACANFLKIRWITYMGQKWKVKNIEVQFPRLVATIGGEFNEE